MASKKNKENPGTLVGSKKKDIASMPGAMAHSSRGKIQLENPFIGTGYQPKESTEIEDDEDQTEVDHDRTISSDDDESIEE
jgi:hypothetical protein